MRGFSLGRVIAAVIAIIIVGVGFYLFLSPGRNQTAAGTRATVAVTHPHRGDIAHSLETDSELEAWEVADLFPKVSGYLTDVRFDIGDHVKAGQVLAVISVPELDKQLAEDEAQLAAKRADLTLQQVTLKRQEELFKGHAITDQAFDTSKAQAAVAVAQADLAAATVAKDKTLLAYTQIVAPFDGIVAQRLVNRGDFVQAATGALSSSLFTVEDIATVRVFAEVPESDVARLHVGDPASVKAYGLSGEAVKGTIARFAYRLDPATRNMRTEVDLPNPDNRLYPGMYARVALATDQRHNVLTLPSSAVLSDSTGSFVYVIKDNHIERRPIRTGLADGGAVEIVDGLTEADTVVTTGKGAPAPGTAVQIASQHGS